MLALVEVAILIGVATVQADEWAHRDELAARRFRELSPAVVAGQLDKARNRRWHRVGFRQRLEVVLLTAVMLGAATGNWLAAGLAFGLMGSVVSLVFDISFNRRMGLAWDYTGTTAWFDQWLNLPWMPEIWPAGKLAAAVELLLVLGFSVAWLILI